MIIIFKLIKTENNDEKKLEIYDGAFTEKDYISPSYIDLSNPRYIEIDNTYYSGLLVVNYNREQTEILLKNLIDSNIDMNISMFYEKKD